MKAYVINLPQDAARRESMYSELQKTPFADIEFVEGVDGRAMAPAELHEAFDFTRFIEQHYGCANSAEAGCALSHHKCWQLIADSREPAFIMEDDISFEGSWHTILEVTEKWLDSPEPRALILSRHFFYRERESTTGVIFTRPLMCYGAECYAINPACATLLLSLGKPSFLSDEWDYFISKGVDLRAIIPHPVKHGKHNASIIGSHYNERFDWEGIRHSVQPDIFLFNYPKNLILTTLNKLGIIRRHVSKEEYESLHS